MSHAPGQGADSEARDIHEYTSFHYAAYYGHLAICKFIIEQGNKKASLPWRERLIRGQSLAPEGKSSVPFLKRLARPINTSMTPGIGYAVKPFISKVAHLMNLPVITEKLTQPQ